jgi:DNA invertase Pin-like site-specific DNA recombinase
MHIIAAVTEFERTLISERVKGGIARAGGKPWGGKPRKVIAVARVRELKSRAGRTSRSAGF